MNYGELKAAVTAYTHRADLDPLFPIFLDLAEQRIYYGESNSPRIRCAAMRQTTTLADGTRPAGFLEAIKVTQGGSQEKTLAYRPIDQMPRECRAYTWDGETLVLSQHEAFPVSLTYYARLATPVEDSDENWLMANAPGLYLASLLVEAYRWAVDDVSAAREAGNYSSAANSLNSHEEAAKISGSPLAIQRRGY